jgi:hypothetical protein
MSLDNTSHPGRPGPDEFSELRAAGKQFGWSGRSATNSVDLERRSCDLGRLAVPLSHVPNQFSELN